MVLSSLHTSLRAFDFGSGGPLACFSHVFTNMFDRRCADMFGHVCLFGSGGPLACLVMFKQTCWELWSLLHMAHWHVYILFDRLTCTMTCQVKQMIGIVSWAKVPWQKLQTKVVSTSCFEMSWWGSLEAKYFLFFELAVVVRVNNKNIPCWRCPIKCMLQMHCTVFLTQADPSTSSM